MAESRRFLPLGGVLFAVVQEVLTPDWRYPKMDFGPEYMLREFETLDSKDDIQALFVGVSTSEFSIDPMRIYEDAGVATFNLSSPNQPINASSALLKLAFEKVKPKYVFYEVSTLFTGFDAAPYHWLFDSMTLASKAPLASAYAQNYPKEKRVDAFIDAYFPIYQYHERWKELSKVDFQILQEEKNLYRKGNYSGIKVEAATVTVDLMNEIADANYNNTLWKNEYIKGTLQTVIGESPGANGKRLLNTDVPERNIDTLLEMKTLCEENGAELILMKIPQINYPQYDSSWPRLCSDRVKAIAEECGIRYLDLLYDFDCAIDFGTDTNDGGTHLNYLGSIRITSFFTTYLQNILSCSPAYCEDYDEDLPIFDAVCRLEDLSTTLDLIPYLEELSGWEDVTVFFSASDDMMLNLSPESRQALNDFGLQTDFDTLSYNDSFLAIKENGQVVYEASSNQRLVYNGQMRNGIPYTVTSCGWRLGSESKIIINGSNYSQNSRGINIVVYDNVSGLVLDRVSFDTYAGNQRAERTVYTDLREYEEYLMRLDAENGIGV